VSASIPTTEILEKILAGQRISEKDALHLFEHADLADLSRTATAVRNRHTAPSRVSYVVDRNVNYTDVCNVYCTFCAFYHRPGDARGYVLTRDQLKQKAKETKELGGTGFLLQGGVNPDLPWDYYLDLVRFLPKDMGIWVHGFPPGGSNVVGVDRKVPSGNDPGTSGGGPWEHSRGWRRDPGRPDSPADRAPEGGG